MSKTETIHGYHSKNETSYRNSINTEIIYGYVATQKKSQDDVAILRQCMDIVAKMRQNMDTVANLRES